MMLKEVEKEEKDNREGENGADDECVTQSLEKLGIPKRRSL